MMLTIVKLGSVLIMKEKMMGDMAIKMILIRIRKLCNIS